MVAASTFCKQTNGASQIIPATRNYSTRALAYLFCRSLQLKNGVKRTTMSDTQSATTSAQGTNSFRRQNTTLDAELVDMIIVKCMR